MKAFQYILICVLALVSGYIGASFENKKAAATTYVETAYARVVNTGALRCGYALWPPVALVKDANTGKISGVFHDIIEEAAKNLNLKVEWVEETGWGNWIEGLKSKRFDVFCAGIWQNASRGREAGFTMPLFYSPVYAYARLEDPRFDKDFSLVNNPDIRVSGQDGEMSEIIAHTHFPKAKYVGQPQMSEAALIFLNVAGGKADIVFNEPSIAEDFMAKNAGKLKRISDKPFEFFSTSFGVSIHEFELKQMLDSALIELHNNGTIEKIFQNYNITDDQFLRIAPPYKNLAH